MLLTYHGYWKPPHLLFVSTQGPFDTSLLLESETGSPADGVHGRQKFGGTVQSH